MESKADIGLIGLAIMGQNLVLNMNDHGYTVAVFNRTTSKLDDFLEGNAKGTSVIGTYSIEELVATIKKPRRVMLMVKAGDPVDKFIDLLIPHLDQGDIIIDGGNSNFHDSIRRTRYVESKGLHFVGTGVSGGEEGAPVVLDLRMVAVDADLGCCDEDVEMLNAFQHGVAGRRPGQVRPGNIPTDR